VHGSLAGHLLIATPVIGDPNFERTVVFLLDHGDEGALGLVVNRPTDVELGESLPQWVDLSAPPAVVFVGGPVEQAAAIGLGRPTPGAPLDGPAPGEGEGDEVWSPVLTALGTVGPLATLDLSADPLVAPGLDAVRVYVGYAGWGPGQLEAEIDQEAWLVGRARPDDLWSEQPEDLWSAVLRRRRGRSAWLALYPRDPSGN
jgi:putative transcriptional regulator